MKYKLISFAKFLGFVLFLGMCFTMLSKDVTARAAEDVRLNVKTASIVRDTRFKLKVYNITETQTVKFRSANPEIATVSAKGYITGISNGTTVITATVIEEDAPVAVLQCDVLVGPAALSIKLTKTDLVMKVGSKKTLKTIITPLNTVESPIFYSSDTAIASVSSAGRIRAKEVGQVQVFAFLANGQAAECSVTVLSEDDYLLYLDGVDPSTLLPDDPEPVETPDEEPEENTETPEIEEVEEPAVPGADAAADAQNATSTAISVTAEPVAAGSDNTAK